MLTFISRFSQSLASRTIRFGLIGIGCLGLFMGMGLMEMVLITYPVEPLSPIDAAQALYLGANTCLTCHQDPTHLWSEAVLTRTPNSRIMNPSIVQIASDVTKRQIIITREAHTYQADASQTLFGASRRQQYVMETETGNTTLSARWNGSHAETALSDNDAYFNDCQLCHVPGFLTDTSLSASSAIYLLY